MYCNKCNSNIPNDSDFCPICGNKIEEKKEEKKTISISFEKAIVLFIIGIIIIIGTIATFVYYIINNDNIKENEIDSINGNQNVKEQDSQYSINKNNIYEEYKKVLEIFNKEADKINSQDPSGIGVMDFQYGLVDINNDNIKELVICFGTCNADMQFTFYTYKNNNAIRLGENYASNSRLYKMDSGNYLKQVQMSMRI